MKINLNDARFIITMTLLGFFLIAPSAVSKEILPTITGLLGTIVGWWFGTNTPSKTN